MIKSNIGFVKSSVQAESARKAMIKLSIGFVKSIDQAKKTLCSSVLPLSLLPPIGEASGAENAPVP